MTISQTGVQYEISLRSPENNLKMECASAGKKALFRKELADHLRSRRFLILLLLIGSSCFAGLYGAISVIGEMSGSDYLFLLLFSSSGNSIPSFMSMLSLLGPFIGLAMGFDAINSERNSGTLNRLVSQPIYRDSIIIAKFTAGSTMILWLVFSVGIIAGAAGIYVTGIRPTLEEGLRFLIYLVFVWVYISFWLALAILFSVICRHSATSALAVISLWIFFTLFMSMVADIIANLVYPVNDQYQMMFNSMSNYIWKQNLNRISPYYLFSEAASTIMNPSVRTVNVVTVQQLDGAISGYLSLGQSLLLVWPHLTGMLALMILSFTVSYVSFMRQEIRSS